MTMKNKYEDINLSNDTSNIKLCGAEQRGKEPLPLELSITNCPINCKDCKVVYSNKPTGFRIVCRCNCHFAADNRREN